MTELEGSYINVADATTYFTGDPRSTAAFIAAIAWYLKRATKAIDNLPLKGYKWSDNDTQQRAFPRIPDRVAQVIPYDSEILFQSEEDYDEVPQEVLDACCEEALSLYLLNNDASSVQRQLLQAQGVVSFSIGKLSETYMSMGKSNKNTGALLSHEAYNLLKPWIAGIFEAV